MKEGQQGVAIAPCFRLVGPLVVVLPGVIEYHILKGHAAARELPAGLPDAGQGDTLTHG